MSYSTLFYFMQIDFRIDVLLQTAIAVRGNNIFLVESKDNNNNNCRRGWIKTKHHSSIIIIIISAHALQFSTLCADSDIIFQHVFDIYECIARKWNDGGGGERMEKIWSIWKSYNSLCICAGNIWYVHTFSPVMRSWWSKSSGPRYHEIYVYIHMCVFILLRKT